MDKGLLITIGAPIIVVAVILGAIYFTGGFSNDGGAINVPDISGIILFYGDTCPHCKNVDDFIKANGIDQKVEFTNLEVYQNKSNAALLLQKAKICGINQKDLGVPFAWDGQKCYMGEPDVTSFFKNAAGIE